MAALKQCPSILSSHFDRNFLMVLVITGFYDGKMHVVFTINGKNFPIPDVYGKEGELVKDPHCKSKRASASDAFAWSPHACLEP